MKNILHHGIVVKNLEQSIEFYQSILELELIEGPSDEIKSKSLDIALSVKGANLRVAILKVGDSVLELLEYISPQSSIETPMPPQTLGMMHLAFEVDNIKEKMMTLTEKGVVFNSEIQVLDNGDKWVYFKDINGIALELVEIKK